MLFKVGTVNRITLNCRKGEIMSQILFCFICIFAFMLMYLSDEKNNKKILLFAVIFLSLAAGLRADNVGVDTPGYIYSLNNDFPIPWKFEEEGFRFISRFLMNICNNTTCILFVYSLLTNLLILYRLWDFRTKCSFKFMSFMYLTIYYINTMNIIRQCIAIALIFWATRFLEKKKYLLFIIILIIASSIHKTALLGVFFFFVFFWKNATTIQRKYLLIPIIIIMPITVYFVLKAETGHISNYLSQNTANINITFVYRLGCFLIAMILQNIKYGFVIVKNKAKKNDYCIPIKWSDNDTIFYLFGLITSSLGMFYSYMSRIGLYYLMYEIVFWGKTIKNGKNKQVLFIFITIYALYVFLYELIVNGSKIFPYSIHWF